MNKPHTNKHVDDLIREVQPPSTLSRVGSFLADALCFIVAVLALAFSCHTVIELICRP
jgi:hypothetical protein